MPDVGVLELKIAANVRSATDSLKTLKNRLADIKSATEKFNLENVSTQIQGIVNTVKGSNEVSTAVKNLSSLLNAIASFSKIKGFGLDEAQIKSLQELQNIANGFKMGAAGVQMNQLRLAISEPWDAANAQSAATAMEAIATGANSLASSGAEAKISKISTALKDYSTAINELKASLGNGVNIPTAVTAGNGEGFVALGLASSQGMMEGITEGTSGVISAAKEMADAAKDATASELEIHSPSRVYHELGMQTAAGFDNGLRDGLNNINVYGPLEALEKKFMFASISIGEKVSASLSSLRTYKEAMLETGHRLDPEQFGIPVATQNIDTAKQSLDGFAETSETVKEVETIVKNIGNAEAEIASSIQASNRSREETLRIRKEEMALDTQRIQEKNYEKYRGVYLEKEKGIYDQIPGMLGLTPKSLEEGETYAKALAITLQEVDEYVNRFIEKMNTPTGPLLRDVIDESMGINASFKNARESAAYMDAAIAKRKRLQELSDTANETIEAFNKLASTNERIKELTTKLGFIQEDLAKEMESGDPSERRVNELELRINSLIGQIDTLNSKSLKLDFAKDITPESLGELSEIDRLIQKREDLVRTLHEEMEVNKLSVSQIMTRMGQIESLTDKIEKLRLKEEEEQSVRLSVRETNDMAQRIGQLDMLIEKSEEAKAAYNELINDPNATNGERIAAALKINKAELEIQQYNDLQSLLANVSPEIQKFAQDQLNAGVSASTLRSKLFDLDGELKQKKTDMRNVADETKSLAARFSELMFGTDGLKGSMKRMFPTITGLLNRFRQLVKYRMLRAVIKQISEGFKEGYENYYHYSEAIGSGFAPSMDSATSSLLQMKNSIGAAVAPLLQSLVPVLQTVVNWFISAVNWANQFIALLRGQSTWSRATTQSAKAFDDTKKAAKGAGAAIKDLLADWDELNIIQSDSNGSGSGTGAKAMEDYLNMFEEVNTFDDNIRKVTDYIKDNMDDISRLAIEVGAAILGWKVSSAFKGILGTLGSVMGTIATVALTLELTDQFGQLYAKTGDVGWLIADALSGAVGSALAGTIASKLASKEMAGTVRLSAGGFVLSVAGLVNLINSGKAASQENYSEAQMLSLLGSAELGIGTALVSKGLLETSAMFSFGLGAAVGVTAFLVTLGINATIEAGNNAINWGENKLTSEQIEAYVNQELFGINIPVTVESIDANIENADIKRDEIENSLQTALKDFNIIKLGIADEQDYETMQSDVNALVDAVSGYINTAENTAKLTMQLVPKLVGDNEQDASKWYKNYVTGWDKVDEFAKTTGARIGKLLVAAEKDELKEGEPELLNTLMTQLSNLSATLANAQLSGEALGNMTAGLAGFDRMTSLEISKVFGQYVDDLRKGLTAQATEQLSLQKQLVEALFIISEDPENDPVYIQAKRDYENMVKNFMSGIDDAVIRYSAEGFASLEEMLRERFGEKIADNLLPDFFSEALAFNRFSFDESATTRDIAKGINEMLSGSFMYVNKDLQEIAENTGISAWNLLTDELRKMARTRLEEVFGEETTQEIIDIWERKNVEVELPDVDAKVTVHTELQEETETAQGKKSGLAAVSDLPLSERKDILSIDIGGKEVQRTIIDPIESVTEAVNDYVEAVEKVNKLMIGRHGRELVQDMLQFMADPSTTARNINDRLSEARLKNSVSGGGWNDYLEVRDIIQSMIDSYKEMYEAGHIDIFKLLDEFADFGTGEGISIPVTLIPEIDWSKLETEKELEFHDVDPADFTGRMHNFNPNNISASGGMADMWGSGWHGNGGGAQPVIVQNDAEQQNNTAAGVQKGTVELESMLSQILTFVRRIEGKEFTAKVVPSSGIGRSNALSADLFNRVTGQNA